MSVPLPWYVKIASKIVLSRLPVPYSFWRSIGLFRNGPMDKVEYAIKIFCNHADRTFGDTDISGKTVMEMGSGDSVASALVACAKGADKVYLIDVGSFATQDMDFYRMLAQELNKRDGFSLPQITQDTSFKEMLTLCKASYLTEGLNSLKNLPDNSVDFLWSHSCLEHVRRHEFLETMKQIHRILKSNGTVSHSIDLKDHLGGRLNNLRFSHSTWESDFMVQSGFYTNRLRATDYEESFKKSGFQVVDWQEGQWDSIPTPRSKMDKDFRDLPDRDLLVRTISTCLKKAA